MSTQPCELAPLVPFREGTLSPEHRQEIAKIRSCLQAWLKTIEHARKRPGEKEKTTEAMNILSNLQVDVPSAFMPSDSPPYKYRAVLLSCTRCYWTALVASLDEDKKKQLAVRLSVIPPFGERVPAFDSTRCVEQADALKASEYEGLMRVAAFVVVGLAANEVVMMWRELGMVGVQTWEERD